MYDNTQAESTAKLWFGMEATIKEQQAKLNLLAEAVLAAHQDEPVCTGCIRSDCDQCSVDQCNDAGGCKCSACILAREVLSNDRF
jgi:hypothetical protein